MLDIHRLKTNCRNTVFVVSFLYIPFLGYLLVERGGGQFGPEYLKNLLDRYVGQGRRILEVHSVGK